MKKVCLYSICFFLIDFLVKLVIKINLNLYESIVVIPNFFSLTFVYNEGASFSILEGKKVFLVLLGLILITILFLYLRKEKLTNYKITYYSFSIKYIKHHKSKY